MRRAVAVVAVLLAAGCGRSGPSAPVATGEPPTSAVQTSGDSVAFRSELLGTYDRPVWAGSPPGDSKIYVVEQHAGRIMVIGETTPFLELPEPASDGNEQGLLGLAFHPQFATNGRYFVDYTNADGDSRVVEFHAGDSAPVREWLAVDQPYDNHNGGDVVFGPDGRLYVGMGDGGSGGDPENRAQDDGSLLGKLLAIAVDGGDPKPVAVAKGLRNPWRFSFASDGSSIWIGDVGQNEWEEIDHAAFPLPDGANFGWRLLEGTHPFEDGGGAPKGYVAPVFQYSHDDGCSVTGGVAVGSLYLFGDYCSSRYWAIEGDRARLATLAVQQPVHFSAAPDGSILVVSGGGGVYRVTPI